MAATHEEMAACCPEEDDTDPPQAARPDSFTCCRWMTKPRWVLLLGFTAIFAMAAWSAHKTGPPQLTVPAGRPGYPSGAKVDICIGCNFYTSAR